MQTFTGSLARYVSTTLAVLFVVMTIGCGGGVSIPSTDVSYETPSDSSEGQNPVFEFDWEGLHYQVWPDGSYEGYGKAPAPVMEPPSADGTELVTGEALRFTAEAPLDVPDELEQPYFEALASYLDQVRIPDEIAAQGIVAINDYLNTISLPDDSVLTPHRESINNWLRSEYRKMSDDPGKGLAKTTSAAGDIIVPGSEFSPDLVLGNVRVNPDGSCDLLAGPGEVAAVAFRINADGTFVDNYPTDVYVDTGNDADEYAVGAADYSEMRWAYPQMSEMIGSGWTNIYTGDETVGFNDCVLSYQHELFVVVGTAGNNVHIDELVIATIPGHLAGPRARVTHVKDVRVRGDGGEKGTSTLQQWLKVAQSAVFLPKELFRLVCNLADEQKVEYGWYYTHGTANSLFTYLEREPTGGSFGFIGQQNAPEELFVDDDNLQAGAITPDIGLLINYRSQDVSFNSQGKVTLSSYTNNWPVTIPILTVQNVVATDGTSTTGITITWDAVEYAESYDLYRDSQGSAYVTSILTNSYEDASVPDFSAHTYWVKANDGGATSSEFSASDTGYKDGLPTAAFTALPTTVQAGEPIALDASTSVDGDNQGSGAFNYEWDWDNDGTYDYATESNSTSHVYSTPGTKTITLRFTDNEESSDTATAQVTVADNTWIHTWGGGSDEGGEAIGLDASGNHYSTGYYTGASAQKSIIFLEKRSSSGVTQMRKAWTGGYTDQAQCLLVDDTNGRIYVGGSTTSFDPPGYTDSDFLIVVFDSTTGAALSVYTWGDPDVPDGSVVAMDFDSTGKLIVVGNSQEYAGGDYIVLKVDITTTPWTIANDDHAHIGLSATGMPDTLTGMAIDASDNIYLSGHSTTATASDEVLVVKVSSTLSTVWQFTYGGSGSDIATNLQMNAAGTVLYIAGYSSSNDDDGQIGLSDAFVLRVSTSDGSILGSTRLGSTSPDIVESLVLDETNDKIYVGFDHGGSYLVAAVTECVASTLALTASSKLETAHMRDMVLNGTKLSFAGWAENNQCTWGTLSGISSAALSLTHNPSASVDNGDTTGVVGGPHSVSSSDAPAGNEDTGDGDGFDLLVGLFDPTS